MNIIDMSKVVGSDTLCDFYDEDNCLIGSGVLGGIESVFKSKVFSPKFMESVTNYVFKCKISEDYFQSTANNLVIPEGLICHVEYIDSEGYIAEEQVLSKGDNFLSGSNCITAIKVTGKQEGWAYAWEVE